MTQILRVKALLRKWWFWPVAAAVVVALALPAVAYAATVETYSQGNSYNSGDFILQTSNAEGFLNRNYDRVYHASGHEWEVWYNTSGGSSVDIVDSTGNPTDNNIAHNSVQAFCWDIGDGSGSLFTCQTTHP